MNDNYDYPENGIRRPRAKKNSRITTIFIIIAILISICVMVFLGGCSSASGRRITTIGRRYYLDIPDSPRAVAHLQLKLISHDTAYFGWYTTPRLRDYQMDVNNKGILIYDNERFINFLRTHEAPALDSIIEEDNK